MSKWIVVLNRPHYPEVTEFDSENEAKAELLRILQEEADEGGKHKATAFVAEVTRRIEIRTTH